jgi:hypothetical protein
MQHPEPIKNNFTPNTAINFRPLNLDRVYGVVFSFWQGERRQTVHFEIKLLCKKRMDDGRFLFEIQKEQVYINGAAPDNLVDSLADQCGKVLYPLQVIVSPGGRFVSVFNDKEIARRWQEEKPRITRYYKGRIAEKTVQYMDLAIASKPHLYQSLCNDWFMALYFSGSCFFTDQETDVYLPLVPYCKPVAYHVLNTMEPGTAESSYCTIHQTGQCADNRSVEDLLNANPVPLSGQLYGKHTPANGQLNITYKLYKHDGTIQSVTGTCSLQLQEKDPKYVEIQVYHLAERDTALPHNRVSLLADEQEKDKVKRRSFFSLFK